MNPKDNWYEKEKLVKNDVIYEASAKKTLNCCSVYIEPIPQCFVQKIIQEKCGSS